MTPVDATARERPTVGVAVMVEKDGKVLMGRRKCPPGEGTWALPGGHVEFGEKLADAAIRETKEETGLDISGIEIISLSDDISYGRHFVSITFRAAAAKGQPILKVNKEFSEMGWFDLKNPPEPTFKALENVLSNYFSNRIYGGKDFGGE
jgi:8-oxo-dGTP diphosphatase